MGQAGGRFLGGAERQRRQRHAEDGRQDPVFVTTETHAYLPKLTTACGPARTLPGRKRLGFPQWSYPPARRTVSSHADIFLRPSIPIAEHARLDLEAVLLDHFQNHAFALHIVLLALGALLALRDGVVELLLVNLAVVAGEGVDEVLDLAEDAGFEDVAVALANLGQRGAGGVHGDALLQRD